MFEPNVHVGEDAELYALGQLDDLARERVERHVRVCGQCARRVGEAESTVLRLIEAQVPPAPSALRPFDVQGSRHTWRWVAALAAAFVLGLLPWLTGTLRSTAPSATEQLAMTAMLNGHFMHAPFAADVSGAPNGKAIYARDGAWVYVLIAPAGDALDVVGFKNGKSSNLGTIPPGSATRGEFFSGTHRPERLELRDRGKTIAAATLVYPAASHR